MLLTTKTNWAEFYSSCTEDELGGIALLRVIECSNGCIQHLFRANDPRALCIEKTRETMKFSMGLMKEMSFSLGDQTYSFSPNTEKHLREIRELYVRGFKNKDDEALEEFYQSSYACIRALGNDRIIEAGNKVRKYLSDVFPEHTVTWGENYLQNLIKMSEKE